MQTLNGNLKQKILSSSAKAIKVCIKQCTNEISFLRLHEMCNRATPDNYLLYKHALCLFKLLTEQNTHTYEWIALNFNQILTSRQVKFKAVKANRKRVGLNALANRLSILNDRIPLDWLNLSYESYKIKCKNEFLK